VHTNETIRQLKSFLKINTEKIRETNLPLQNSFFLRKDSIGLLTNISYLENSKYVNGNKIILKK
jgi:hypothetical protein